MSNRSAFSAVIYVLGGALLLCIVGVIVLATLGQELPPLLGQIAVGALAGLGGLLTHPPTADVQPVVGVPGGEPVATEPQLPADDGPPAAMVRAPRKRVAR